MQRFLESFSVVSLRFALAIWFGGGLAVLLSTRAIFGAAATRAQGGLFSGAALASFLRLRWVAVALTAIPWLIGLGALLVYEANEPPEWKSSRFSVDAYAILAAAAAVLTAIQASLDRRIRSLREQLGGSTEGLAPEDPRRKRWGALHGASVLLLLAQIGCGAAGLWLAA